MSLTIPAITTVVLRDDGAPIYDLISDSGITISQLAETQAEGSIWRHNSEKRPVITIRSFPDNFSDRIVRPCVIINWRTWWETIECLMYLAGKFEDEDRS